MALYDDDGEQIVAPKQEPKGPVIDTASVYQNRNSRDVIAHLIEGSSWTVDYYSQYLGSDDVGTHHHDVPDSTQKQYKRIKNMELRVVDMLSSTTDSSTKRTTVSGSANFFAMVTPETGDFFIAEVGEGYKAVVTVTSTERQSHYKGTAWRIDYTLTEYVPDDHYKTIEKYVVDTLIFDVEGLIEENRPLLTESEWDRKVSRVKFRKELIQYYFTQFYSLDEVTFLVPRKFHKLFDHYMVDFWLRFIPKDDIGKFEQPQQWDVRNGIYTNPYNTVLDAFYQRSPLVLKTCVKKMGPVSTSPFGSSYFYNNLLTSRISQVLQPSEVNGTTVAGITSSCGVTIAEDDSSEDSLPEYYIFSEAFYTGNKQAMEPLELMIHDYINGKDIFAYKDVEACALALLDETAIKKFYLIPFAIVMMNVSR